MRILITGGLGQLGRALQKILVQHDLAIADLPEVDICERSSFEKAATRFQPDLIIHCAAYTDVDGSARDPAFAFRVNALGTQNVALTCQEIGCDLAHISTNEVFSGRRPDGYEEWMAPDPINPYGRSKAAAEFFVKTILQRYYIVRTAWLYGPGGRNFIHAILKRAQETGEIRVVTDEIGNPTYVKDLAGAISELVTTKQYGIYHFVNEGACSRWTFANEILHQVGLDQVRNTPILTRDYRRASTPPLFGALLNIAGKAIGISLRPWQVALAEFMAEMNLNNGV